MFAQAAFWGLLAGSGLLIGAVVAVAYVGRLSHRIIAATMGFGGGVLIAVLSVDLMDSAFRDGGPMAATFGFLFGATAFSAINWRLAQYGASTAIAAATASRNHRRQSTKGADGRSR
jgi:zinc transporter, ZIP family